MVTAWAWLALASWLCLVASASGDVKFDSGDDGGSRRIDDAGEQLFTEQQMAEGIFPEDDSSPIIDPDRFYFLAPLLQQDPGALRVRRAPGIVSGFGGNNMNGLGNRGPGMSGSTLSIVNPIDVLRQRVRLEFQRMRMRENEEKMKQNREFMKSIGRKRFDRPSQMQRRIDNNGWGFRGAEQWIEPDYLNQS